MKKRALLLGMFHYQPSRSIKAEDLPSTEYDVNTLTKKLKQLQFETTSHMDLCLIDAISAVRAFAESAPCDSLNIIYFSGHGGHSKGENYLYTVDFGVNLDRGLPIRDSAINIKDLSTFFVRKVKLLIIVDACRDNLTPDYGRNYSEMIAPQDTYIAYATQFGDSSLCSPKSSYFTEMLCENILTPNNSIDQLFTNVRAALYLKHGKQISNSVNGLMSFVTLNQAIEQDDVGEAVLQFIDKYGDMYVDKYGCFAGDDLVFIDAAQYCGVSVLDAIYKFLKLDAERCHVMRPLTESHEKLIAFWGMLGHGLKQNEFYTWEYRGRPIRLGEIPPLPFDMQKPMPDEEKEIEVEIKVAANSTGLVLQTNLPDNFTFWGKINGTIAFSDVVVRSGVATIPFDNAAKEFNSLDAYSVLPTVTGVNMSIVGDRCRNLTGKYVRFKPINGNTIEFHIS